jgi:hypothetical protein
LGIQLENIPLLKSPSVSSVPSIVTTNIPNDRGFSRPNIPRAPEMTVFILCAFVEKQSCELPSLPWLALWRMRSGRPLTIVLRKIRRFVTRKNGFAALSEIVPLAETEQTRTAGGQQSVTQPASSHYLTNQPSRLNA